MQSFAVQVLQEAADPSVTGIFSFRGTVFVLKIELRNSPAGYLVIGRQSFGHDVFTETKD